MNYRIIPAQKTSYKLEDIRDTKRKRMILETSILDVFQQVVEEVKFESSTLPPPVFEYCFSLDGTYILDEIKKVQVYHKLSQLYPFERSNETNFFECHSPKLVEKIGMQLIEHWIDDFDIKSLVERITPSLHPDIWSSHYFHDVDVEECEILQKCDKIIFEELGYYIAVDPNIEYYSLDILVIRKKTEVILKFLAVNKNNQKDS